MVITYLQAAMVGNSGLRKSVYGGNKRATKWKVLGKALLWLACIENFRFNSIDNLLI